VKKENFTFVKKKYRPAIKEFLVSLSDNPHPNFPVIVEVKDEFYVMEYIEGDTLEDIVSKSPLSPDGAKDVILQLLDAVEFMHEMGIIHRDIKPENIVIANDGVLKLIDFDISRKVVSDKSKDTRLLGTAGYASPEQYGFTQTDQRSDIYSIGIVYNYLLTGKFITEKIADGQIGKIIRKCTQIDKSKRYKDIKLLRKDIQAGIFTSYNLFDIIPGFRTRNIYKMIIASIFYFIFFVGYFVLIYDQAPRDNTPELIMFCVIVFAIILFNFLFFSILTNFLNIVDRIKFPLKKTWHKKIALLSLLYITATAICFAVMGNFLDAMRLNPINMTFSLLGYMIYSLIHDFVFGML